MSAATAHDGRAAFDALWTEAQQRCLELDQPFPVARPHRCMLIDAAIEAGSPHVCRHLIDSFGVEAVRYPEVQLAIRRGRRFVDAS